MPLPADRFRAAARRPATAPAVAVAACVVGLLGCDRPPDAAAPARPAPAQETVATPPQAAALPVANPSRAAAPRDISFDDVKLEMQKGEPFTRDRLTPRVTALEGSRVRIRGYILPSFQQTGLTQFVLVRDNMECCFGPGAALHDCVVVRMVPGKTAEFSIRPVAVTGTFRVEELRGPDGRHLAIYALDGEGVQ
ncbi:MAG: hypothetical protein RLZZ111_1326 [Planctomycetota bacterium]